MNFLPFEHFEAEMERAPLVDVLQGTITVDGHDFFDRSLKSRRKVKAFVDISFPICLQVCVFSEAGRFLCNASEQDPMGLDILKPGFKWPAEFFAPAY